MPPRSSFFLLFQVSPSLFFFAHTELFSLSLFPPVSLPPGPKPNPKPTKKKKKSATNAKHVFYLSAEFLMGRSLTNAVGNLKLEDAYGEAVKVRRVCFPL